MPGADLAGVHFAMDYLAPTEPPRGRRSAALTASRPIIHAKDKHVIVIGGGDTGSDCVGTSIRQEALSVTQLEILPRPPEGDNPETPWPFWPKIMRTSSSQEEGCQRRWSTLTKALTGADGRVTELHACEVAWCPGPKGWQMQEIAGTEFTLPADLVLVAMGFVHVAHSGLVTDLGINLDGHGNVVVSRWMSSVPGVFAAGDTVRARRWWSTPSTRAGSAPPRATSGCGREASGAQGGSYALPAIVRPPSTGRQTPVT